MTLGPTAFALVVWGAVLAVLVVFGYEVYALAVDAGLVGGADAERADAEGEAERSGADRPDVE